MLVKGAPWNQYPSQTLYMTGLHFDTVSLNNTFHLFADVGLYFLVFNMHYTTSWILIKYSRIIAFWITVQLIYISAVSTIMQSRSRYNFGIVFPIMATRVTRQCFLISNLAHRLMGSSRITLNNQVMERLFWIKRRWNMLQFLTCITPHSPHNESSLDIRFI